MHRKEVSARVKYQILYRHQDEYSVAVMCKFFEVSRSGYYDFVKRIGRAEGDAELARLIQECQDKSDKTYGDRRMWKWLKDRSIQKNPKTVLRVIKKYGLLSEIRRRGKWVNPGQQVHKYANLLDRHFQAERPNAKWVTDIAYIQTKEGVLWKHGAHYFPQSLTSPLAFEKFLLIIETADTFMDMTGWRTRKPYSGRR